MTQNKLNEQILNAVQKNSGNEVIIGKFIKKLLIIEAQKSNRWQYKQEYIDEIKKHSKDWEEEQ